MQREGTGELVKIDHMSTQVVGDAASHTKS
jgi:hypothetical protein